MVVISFVENPQEIKALIQLLDDPDEDIYTQIREKLISYGSDVIPKLEDSWENQSFGVLFQERIEDIIHSIQFQDVCDRFRSWKQQGAPSLLDGALLLARYQYADLDEEDVRKRIEKIRQDIWLELNDQLTALEQIKVINHVLFDIHEFSPNTKNYHAPQNSFINNVIESRKGNPLSLCMLYIILARGLDIPLYGVNLPNHFVMAYVDHRFASKRLEYGKEVLFYINAFSRGSVFNHKEIENFLSQLNIEPQPKFFSPCSNLDIMVRAVKNLIHAYEKLGYPSKKDELKVILDILQD